MANNITTRELQDSTTGSKAGGGNGIQVQEQPI
jgi:hypothetical protein